MTNLNLYYSKVEKLLKIYIKTLGNQIKANKLFLDFWEGIKID